MNEIFFHKTALACAIGSLPFTDVNQACDFVLETFKEDILFWPQLPKRSFYENMYVQYSQGIPGVVIDEEKRRICIDVESADFLNQLESSLQAYADNNFAYFSIGKDYAVGFHQMLSMLKQQSDVSVVKGQVIGPISFALSVTDQQKQPILYNADVFEIIINCLSMKAKWQIKKFKEINPDVNCIIFIDEPYLVSIGSSFVSLKQEQVVGSINRVIAAIHEAGALVGIHCCGNTDWSIVLSTDLDILNFDAYNYLDNLVLYKDDLRKFFSRDGILAWGIVPTSDEVTKDSLSAETLSQKIVSASEEKELKSAPCIITPSCGCGTIASLDLNQRIHVATTEIASLLSQVGK
ncbi:hypothetical protein ACFL38_04325 [Candidatus Omnitrophota bacterium]